MWAYHRDVAYRLVFIVIMVVISFYKYSVVSKMRAVANPGFERQYLRIANLHTITGVVQHVFPEKFEI